MPETDNGGAGAAPAGETRLETIERVYDEVAARDAGTDDDGAPAPEGETRLETIERVYDELAARGDGADATAAAGADEAAADAPPAHWADADKARYRALAPAQRAAVREMAGLLEADHRQKAAGLEAERARLAGYHELDGLLAPHRETLTKAGMSEAEGLRNLVEVYGLLKRNPLAGINAVARSVGLDLAALAAQPSLAQAAQAAYVREMEARQRALYTKLMEKQATHSDAEWTALAAAKDAAGTPAYPHLDRLRPRMQSEIAALPREQLFGRAPREVLHEAYERAAWADPQTRESLIAGRLETAARDREAKRREDVEKARRAGRPVASQAAPAVEAPRKSGSYLEEIERVWDMLESR